MNRVFYRLSGNKQNTESVKRHDQKTIMNEMKHPKGQKKDLIKVMK